MSKLVLFLLVQMLVSAVARAGFYCEDPSTVSAKTQGDCTNNEYVSEAAVLCLKKLEDEIDAARKLVATTAAATAKASQGTQKGKEANAGADYAFSLASLDLLIHHGEQAQEEIVNLDKGTLAMPEDFDEPEITGMDEPTYLNSVPCFADNRKVIADVLLDFDKYISDLQYARDSASKLEKNTQSSSAKLGGRGKSAARVGGTAADEGSRKTKGPKNAGSTITGVEEERAKETKQP